MKRAYAVDPQWGNKGCVENCSPVSPKPGSIRRNDKLLSRLQK